MNILLLGHNGYLGDYIKNNFDCDVLNTRDVHNNGKKYDYVLNCIGKPDVEFCEKNPEISRYSNCDVILDIKKHYPDSKIINFSSYYCYDDEPTNQQTQKHKHATRTQTNKQASTRASKHANRQTTQTKQNKLS